MTESSESVAPEMSVAQQRKTFKEALAHGLPGHNLAVCSTTPRAGRVLMRRNLVAASVRAVLRRH